MSNVMKLFGEHKKSYFLYGGNLYYAGPVHKCTACFPVKNGIISQSMDEIIIQQNEKIEVIPKENFDKYNLPAEWDKRA